MSASERFSRRAWSSIDGNVWSRSIEGNVPTQSYSKYNTSGNGETKVQTYKPFPVKVLINML